MAPPLFLYGAVTAPYLVARSPSRYTAGITVYGGRARRTFMSLHSSRISIGTAMCLAALLYLTAAPVEAQPGGEPVFPLIPPARYVADVPGLAGAWAVRPGRR